MLDDKLFLELGLLKEDYVKINKVNTLWRRGKKRLITFKIENWKRVRKYRKVSYYEYYSNQLVLANITQTKDTIDMLSEDAQRHYISHLMSVRVEFWEAEWWWKKSYLVWYLPTWHLTQKLANMWYVIYHPKKWRIPQNMYNWYLDEITDLKYFNVHDWALQRLKTVQEKYWACTYWNINKHIRDIEGTYASIEPTKFVKR